MEPLSTNSTPKKNQQKFITNIKKNNEKISFIILSSVNGYKLSHNKYCPILYYGKDPVVNFYTKEIKDNFSNSEIIVVAGKFTDEFTKIKNNFSLIENQLFSVTGECENLRLGIQAASNKKVIIIKENNLININFLVDKSKQFVYTTNEDDKNSPGCVIIENQVKNISFGTKGSYIKNCYLIDQSLNSLYNYCCLEHNKNKMIHEAINSILEDGFIEIK